MTVSSKCEQLIGLEFPDVHILRAESLADLAARDIGPQRLILIEQEAFVEDREAVMRALQSCAAECVVLAYRDESVAFGFLDEVRALDRGLRRRMGVLPMNLQYDCWTSMLRLAFLGQGCVPQGFLSRRASGVRSATVKMAAAAGADKLTPRERQILELVARGKQNKLIAVDLALSEHTVKLHMHHIITKLGVRNRTEAAGVFLGMGR